MAPTTSTPSDIRKKKRLRSRLVRSNNIQSSIRDHNLLGRNDDQSSSTESLMKLNTLQAEFDEHVKESDIKTKESLDTVTELKQQIEELNKNLEMCQDEKEHLQKLLDENNDKLLEFEDRLESAKDVKQEKDIEIKSLQQEIKFMIQRNDADDRSDKLMEAEMKNTIRELTETKEKLSQKEEYVEDLETRIKTSEQNAKIMELLQQSAEERQAENERLRNMNQELKNSLIEKEREMEAFMKNRDEMVTKYETLVKNQQEELEKKKRTATRHQSKEKVYCENTSEEEAISKERRIRRPPRKYSPTPTDVSVIELTSSETKRSSKCAVLAPPLPRRHIQREERTSVKRNYMRQKMNLFKTLNQSRFQARRQYRRVLAV
ncbi:uncharacterized protein LOC143211642 isoform X2 [Lasioglossum baleicum]|uniref:uncharacterized protein LOC143211642 isoform X2 n=1 Tax=Lasioglossum baleicum TaxID=434251 RepID=UPI003FCDE035